MSSTTPRPYLADDFIEDDIDAWITGAQEVGWAILPTNDEQKAVRASMMIATTLGIKPGEWYLVQEDITGWTWRFQIVGADTPEQTRAAIAAQRSSSHAPRKRGLFRR